MSTPHASTRSDRVAIRSFAPWRWLSLAAALIAAIGSIVGLLVTEQIYGHETAQLTDAAIAQDVVNLALVAPLLVVLGIRAARGSLRAYLTWLGCLLFTVYNYAIYAFSVHFGPLFLLWVAVLGLAVFALIGGVTTVDLSTIRNQCVGRALPLTAWLLIILASLFAVLWLSEIIPDLIAGRASRSASAWLVPTNPVHVLDLAIFLPAVLTTGVLLLRRNPVGYLTAPGQLVFLALTCLPILLTPLVAQVRGHDTNWAVTLPIGVVLATTLVVLWRTLRLRITTPNPEHRR